MTSRGAAAGDKIDLHLLDANADVAGDQAFILGGTGEGHLSMVNDHGRTVVEGNADRDAAFEFVLVIEDFKVLANAYTADDFVP